MSKLNIGILSAHEGGAYWIRLVTEINNSDSLFIESLHGFSDDYYRSSKSRFGQLWIKFLIYIIYPAKCFLLLLFEKHKFDGFIVVSSPFYLPFLCILFTRKPVISLNNDIYPEALIIGKIISRGSFWEKFLKKLCRWSNKNSSAVVYICKGHRDLAEREIGHASRTFVIPVGAIGSEFDKEPTIENSCPVRFLYCGTLGIMHDFLTLFRFLCEHKLPNGCKIEFRTSGSGKNKFEKHVKKGLSSLLQNGTIVLGNALNYAEWINAMKTSHIGMVFQLSGAGKVVFPSKIFSILVSGQAVLAIADKNSELGRLVTDNDCGWVVSPGDIDSLKSAFADSLNPEILHKKRLNAYKLGQSRFDIKHLAKKWSRILIECSLY